MSIRASRGRMEWVKNDGTSHRLYLISLLSFISKKYSPIMSSYATANRPAASHHSCYDHDLDFEEKEEESCLSE
jgi:hypothetical protein